VNQPAATVLIVEDTGTCATTLEIALAQIGGIKVEVVPSAERAHGMLNDGAVCALITDLQLPGDSGLQLIEWVRSRENGRHLPIIVVSGLSDPDARSASLSKGADAYFGKPFSPGEVRKKLQELIRS
jgi:DNA-binding response OmpR family regulator